MSGFLRRLRRHSESPGIRTHAADVIEQQAKEIVSLRAERDRLRALLFEFIALCAAGDVDESTKALGWGALIASAKDALKEQT